MKMNYSCIVSLFVVVSVSTSTVIGGTSALWAQTGAWEQVSEAERRTWNETYDKRDLYESKEMERDSASRFTRIPGDMDESLLADVEVARIDPEIAFAPIRGLTPMYFPEENKSLWATWSDVTAAPNGRYYFVVSDNRALDSRMYLVEYNPVEEVVRIVLDIAHLLGWNRLTVGAGRVSGHMGVMPDGTLWMLTSFETTPEPTDEQLREWPGGRLIKYDTFSGLGKDMGTPVAKTGWRSFNLDEENGRLLAVSPDGVILAYDVNEECVTYAGYPPPGISWHHASMILDQSTGVFWSTTAEQPYYFVSFDPSKNLFVRHEETTPNDLGRFSTQNSPVRSYASMVSRGGYIWLGSWNGTLYKFWPETRRTETAAMMWADQTYVPRFAITSDGRYIYYMPNQGQSYSYYQPIVQFNTETSQKKVIAFPADYYFRKYGYYMGGAPGIAVSPDGSTLVLNLNGAFKPRVEPWYGNPAIFAITIPGGER